MTATLLEEAQALIVALRRGVETDANWAALRSLVSGRIDDVCAGFDTRWLVSVCDTYADFGDAIERRNAMLVSTLVNMEKLAQTYVRWSQGYPRRIATPDGPHDKARLWDGMTSMRLDIGDASNHLFGRLDALLAETPDLHRIYETVVRRIAEGDTVLAALDRAHGHVFARDYAWILDEAYDEARETGRVPPHKYERYRKR
jgi:hypothetical protein